MSLKLTHDCFFAHTDPKDLNCKICPKRKPDKQFPGGCTKNKAFPMHDCYYSQQQREAMALCVEPLKSNCFHRFYCTGKVVLPEPEYKYKVEKGKVTLNVKGRKRKHGKV